jgi:putative phosphoribosyl transferase
MCAMSDQSSGHRTGAVTSPGESSSSGRRSVRFEDRRDAGRRLAELLERFRDERAVVVAIPRGGVPVAAEVARALGAPLDVVVVRKIGAPQNPEYAIGALAEGGVYVLSERVAQALGVSEAGIRALLERVERELEERLRRYREAREPIDVHDRTAILVDDGLATGRSARAAVRSLRERGARRVILAAPVAAPAAAQALAEEADEVVCVEQPADLWAVGQWYENFAPPPDEEITRLLSEGAPAGPREGAGGDVPAREVTIALEERLQLSGDLSVPPSARGLVVFAHGSGSGRLSPRNRAVAGTLQAAGYATLLFDLLTPAEEADRGNVFDIPLLASRLRAATGWLREQPDLAGLPLAYFGASTGAAAALNAAAALGDAVRAVISRGGRPDLASGLDHVRAPTLLIVGGADVQVLALNREAQGRLGGPSRLFVIRGATHLFEEPGALEQVARLAVEWLDEHTAPGREQGEGPA